MANYGFEAILAEAERQKNSTPDWGPTYTKLRIPDHNGTAVVRFLEQGQDVFSYHVHNFSKQNGKDGWKTSFPCLDEGANGTPCPGCEYDLKRSFKGMINIIWRDAPTFQKDDDGKFVKDNNGKWIQNGVEDQNAVWEAGITVFTMLAQKDISYKGLMSRDFVVKRTGTDVDNTVYHVEAADVDGGPQPLSEADEKLAADKYDLKKCANFKTYDEAAKIIEDYIGSPLKDTQSSGDVKSFVSSTPFG